MTDYGRINTYGDSEGCGTIIPKPGEGPLAFETADLQQQASEPKTGERYGQKSATKAEASPMQTTSSRIASMTWRAGSGADR